MNCREAFFAIQRHYDGELATEEQTLLDQHLLTCAECRQEFDEYGDFFGDIACLTAPVEHRDVLTPSLDRIGEASRQRRLDIWGRGVAVAASVAVITSTAFFSLTDGGQTLGSQVMKFFRDPVPHHLVVEKEQEVSTFVQDDPQAASVAIEKIRKQVSFTLLELQDERLQLESTQLLTAGAAQGGGQVVDLAYKVVDSEGVNADTIYFLAANEDDMIQRSKYNLGVYPYTGSIQAGSLVWATVGEHALTVEINNIQYQLYSPFLSTEELASYAASLKKESRGDRQK